MLDVVRYALLTAGLLLSGLSAGAYLGSFGQPFEILSNFRIQWALVAFLLLAAALVVRARLSIVLAGLCLTANVGVIVADVMNTLPDTRPGYSGGITAVWMNVESRESAVAALAALAKAENADIVALTEPPKSGAAGVRAALPDFGCVTEPTGRLTPWTTIIATRAPCSASGLSDFVRPSDAVFVDVGRLRVVALHPRAPWGAARTAERDALIRAAVALKAPEGETLLIGDFNASAYSEGLAPVGAQGFKRATCGAPFSATWRDPNPITGLLIDHAFVTPGLQILSCRIGAWTTSDHAPMIVRFTPR